MTSTCEISSYEDGHLRYNLKSQGYLTDNLADFSDPKKQTALPERIGQCCKVLINALLPLLLLNRR